MTYNHWILNYQEKFVSTHSSKCLFNGKSCLYKFLYFLFAADVSAVVNPSLDVQDIYGQPSGELEQVSGHPEGQTHSQPDPKQQAVISVSYVVC